MVLPLCKFYRIIAKFNIVYFWGIVNDWLVSTVKVSEVSAIEYYTCNYRLYGVWAENIGKNKVCWVLKVISEIKLEHELTFGKRVFLLQWNRRNSLKTAIKGISWFLYILYYFLYFHLLYTSFNWKSMRIVIDFELKQNKCKTELVWNTWVRF